MMRLICAVLAAVSVIGCGGGSSAPSTPTTPTPTNSTSDIATITIGTDGRVSPSTVTIPRGGRVTMVNNHNRAHEMASDPHPEHNDCPELNQIGFLQSGQSRTSGNLNTARTCRFHDHQLFNDDGLKGTVVIQ